MAKVKDPFGAREARGSVGGITASRNTMGQYLRCKASPVQPRSGDQQSMRYYFQQLVREFQDLTAAQIQEWVDFAAAWPVTDAFGDSISLTGLNWYQKLNSRLLAIGVASNATPPLNPNCDYISTLDIDQNILSTGDIDITYGTAPTGNERIWIQHTEALPMSSHFAKKSMRQRMRIASTHSSPEQVVAYADCNVTELNLVQFHAFCVDTAGRATPKQRFTVYPVVVS